MTRNLTSRVDRPFCAAILAVLMASASCAEDKPSDTVAVSKPQAAYLAECARLATTALDADAMAVEGKDNWIFLAKELRHMGVGKFWGPEAQTASSASSADMKDPLPAILDFHRQLKELGIELILVPVPPRAVVYADKVSDLAPLDANGLPDNCNPYHQAFYQRLRREGLTVLDLTDTFLAARAADAEQGPVCCMQDTHWSSRGCAIAAEEICKLVAERDWLKKIEKTTYTVEPRQQTLDGDLWQFLGKKDMPREVQTLHHVGTKAAPDNLQPVKADPASPVLLLADSHGLVFHVGGDMHARGAGLADHLAHRLGFPVDEMMRRGSAATSIRLDLARRFYRHPDERAAKKLIIWCFAGREFTETMGWRVFDISPRSK
jgi:alginate O-acetyltransferase complex protein AlgJ